LHVSSAFAFIVLHCILHFASILSLRNLCCPNCHCSIGRNSLFLTTESWPFNSGGG